MGIYEKPLQQLFIAFFNRPADAAGLAYWDNYLSAQSGTLDNVADLFTRTDEYLSVFAGKTPENIVKQIYQNLFGRVAEANGLAFWTELLEKKVVSPAQLVLKIANAAQVVMWR